nr:unnamed protein product [Callosobruchus analis]
MIEGQTLITKVKQALRFGAVLSTQIKENVDCYVLRIEENSSTVSGQKFEEKSETFTKTMIPAELARKMKVRPFWAVPQNVKYRDTCLCEIHVNFHFLISKLKFYSIIKESSSSEITEGITCSAEGTVKGASFKKENAPSVTTKMLGFQNRVLLSMSNMKNGYQKKRVLIKGQEKICVKKVKETLYCNKARILVHMDFSENYVCKYSCEVQSAHFGGSKPQITLHTAVTSENRTDNR